MIPGQMVREWKVSHELSLSDRLSVHDLILDELAKFSHYAQEIEVSSNNIKISGAFINNIDQVMNKIMALIVFFPEAIEHGYRINHPDPCQNAANNRGYGCSYCISLTLPIIAMIHAEGRESGAMLVIREMRRYHSLKMRFFAPITDLELEYELFLLHAVYVHRMIVLPISGNPFATMIKRSHLALLGGPVNDYYRFRDEYESSRKSKSDQIHLIQRIRASCL